MHFRGLHGSPAPSPSATVRVGVTFDKHHRVSSGVLSKMSSYDNHLRLDPMPVKKAVWYRAPRVFSMLDTNRSSAPGSGSYVHPRKLTHRNAHGWQPVRELPPHPIISYAAEPGVVGNDFLILQSTGRSIRRWLRLIPRLASQSCPRWTRLFSINALLRGAHRPI
jgi:hypothetical protein